MSQTWRSWGTVPCIYWRRILRVRGVAHSETLRRRSGSGVLLRINMALEEKGTTGSGEIRSEAWAGWVRNNGIVRLRLLEETQKKTKKRKQRKKDLGFSSE